MDALHLQFGAKKYAELADKITDQPELTLRDVAPELGCILNAFRLMATDYYGAEQNADLGIWYHKFQDMFGSETSCEICKKLNARSV